MLPFTHTFDIYRNNVFVNVNLSDVQWLQASLPVGIDGLGVRSVFSLAPSAFFASAAGTSVLQDNILSSIPSHTDQDVIRVQEIWSNLSKADSQTGITVCSQKSWDNRVTQTVYSDLLEK